MKAFVTGARGALGLSLLKVLHSKNVQVTVTYRQRPLFNDLSDSYIAEQIKCDLLDPTEIAKVLYEVKPTQIFHLAADNDNKEGDSRIGEILGTNIVTTLNLLIAARSLQEPPAVIIASSTEVEMLFDRRTTFTPYRASKIISEVLARCFCDSSSCRVKIVRLPNIYGAGDFNFTRLVPGLIRAAIHKTPVSIVNPHAKRRFLYSDQAAEDLYEIATLKNTGADNSLCYLESNEPVSIAWMHRLIARACNLTETDSTFCESIKRCCDVSTVSSRKRIELANADKHFSTILQTVRWYRSALSTRKM